MVDRLDASLSSHDHVRHPQPHPFPTRRSSDLPRCPASRSASPRPTRVAHSPGPSASAMPARIPAVTVTANTDVSSGRSEEHTSELQSTCNIVCRLLLEKKKTKK